MGFLWSYTYHKIHSRPWNTEGGGML